MAIRLITLDLDHTLWDPHEALIRAEQKMYQWLCEQVPELVELYSYDEFVHHRLAFVRSHLELAWQVSAIRKQATRALLERLGVPESMQADLIEQAFMVFFEERSRLELYPGTVATLKALSAEYSLIALTNGNSSLRLAGVDHWFSAYFNAENVGAPKPHAAMFEAALAHAKVSAAEALHVGDSISMDVLAAKKVGIRAVWANYRGDAWPEAIRPDAEITGIEQLPAAVVSLL